MKRSLKTRLAVTFVLIMLAALVAIGAINWFFMDDYYLYQKQNALTESYQMASAGNTSIDDFEKFCRDNTLTYAMTDSSLSILYSNMRNEEGLITHLFGSIVDMEMDNTKVIKETDDYTISRFSERNSEYLQLIGRVNETGYYIVLCPIASIDVAAAISVRFYIIIGLVVMAASAVIIWFMTKRLSAPVEELTKLSSKMADLEFGARYTSGGEDEIGRLGSNFNTMSDKLETTITDLRNANVQLARDVEEKTQVDEMRREFLSNVSHELKTPIALIQGYAEGLKEMELDRESKDMYCDVIIDESVRMNRLVMQLMDLNQIEAGFETLDIQRFDLAELIRGVINHSALMIEQKEAKVIFNQNTPVAVRADEFRIEEVVRNFFSNALNHLDGDRVIKIDIKEEKDIVTTTVFNTGEPIPEESLDKLWTKFYKVDKARTREYGGSGIGLSIVKAIMEAHGQNCSVKNYSNGVAFSFTLER